MILLRSGTTFLLFAGASDAAAPPCDASGRAVITTSPDGTLNGEQFINITNLKAFETKDRRSVAAVRSKGQRGFQEDTLLVNTKFGEELRQVDFFVPESAELYAVFDGHGGANAANLCVQILEKTLASAWREFQQRSDQGNGFLNQNHGKFTPSMTIDQDYMDGELGADTCAGQDLFHLSKQNQQIYFDLVFEEMEDQLKKMEKSLDSCRMFLRGEDFSKKPEIEYSFDGRNSGTTATIILYDPDNQRLLSAWVGDSPAFLIHKDGTKSNLIIDHGANPSESEGNGEQARVKSRGASIAIGSGKAWRVDNHYGLNMTRSLGDGHHKKELDEMLTKTLEDRRWAPPAWTLNYGPCLGGCLKAFYRQISYGTRDWENMPFGETVISARPGVRAYELKDKEVLAIAVASDGLTDNFPNQPDCSIEIAEHLAKNEELTLVAKKVVQTRSVDEINPDCDNTTLILIGVERTVGSA